MRVHATADIWRQQLTRRCRFPEKLRNVDFAVYEQNEGVGGVWYAQGRFRIGNQTIDIAQVAESIPWNCLRHSV